MSDFAPGPRPVPKGLRVIASSPSFELSGANVLMANLLDELQAKGCETEWICTGYNSAVAKDWLGHRRFKMHSLPATRLSAIRQRQKFLLEYVRQCSPCIYIPNFDFDMACAVPALPPEITAVFIVHCDEPLYYDFVARHGQMFNAIVCVSRFVTQKLQMAHPGWAERIVHIPFGVECPQQLPVRRIQSSSPLEVAYCGRLSFYQKRVHDLAEIIRRCHAQRLPVRFSIAGAGSDEKVFFESIAEPIAAGAVNRLGFLSNAEVLSLLGKADVLLMTSEFEGLPVVLLEAMSRGCIPLVTRTESGMNEVVIDGEGGFLIPVGDVAGFVHALSKLTAEPDLRDRLGRGAFERISAGGFTLARAATDYRKLFESLSGSQSLVKREAQPIIPNRYRFGPRVIKRFQALLGLQQR
jgi:glycosyltransferase involved in cell wall biosynthesis